MKKIIILFLLFIVSITVLWLIDIPFLPTPGKIVLMVAVAIAFEVYLMDSSSSKRKSAAELRKKI